MDDMGNRVAQPRNIQRINVRGLTLEVGLDGTSLWSGLRGIPWPVFARRLDLMGQLKALNYASGRVVMVTNCEADDVVSSFGSHRTRAKSKTGKRWLLILIPVLFVLSMVPLGPSPNSINPRPKAVVNQCSVTAIENWLAGKFPTSSKVKVLESAVLGGVTSGLLECDQVKYSYALGSKEPKRVLNLRKLDS